MSFAITPLKFEKTAVPFLSENTFNFHHGKHFQTYIDTANKLVAGTDYEGKTLEEIITTASGPLFNNAAQAWNHAFYFNCIGTAKKEVPAKLLELINANFDSFESFAEKFIASATTNFGSGWTWLVQTGPNFLKIVNTSNAGNPMVDGFTPLLTVDVWEHAYYLDYQNRRADYLKDFVEYIDWEFVASNLK
ncbi:superoxide dismutase [Anaerobiospirillum thomasii]|uniref:Superoxide dismutase n=1 Tax=Anaerobiospirillum thomasii TaxID=179995 RepID=A0A2X0WVT3_9GAMM|nr:superoxide dismutase [Anaerobiospirillum thomasii]SPT70592.1 Superoxide dismutase [Fe] [Anaerobiospirillum thomasii]